MKKSLVLAMAMALGVTASAYAANPFSDVPAGHWAYDSISKLAAAGVIEGYGDTTFGGDKLMTRYEMAQIVAKAMAKGANCDKLAAEFADELDNLGVRVANLEKKADNVKITGQFRFAYADYDNQKHYMRARTRLFVKGQVNDDWSYTARIQNERDLIKDANSKVDVANPKKSYDNDTTKLNWAFVSGKIGGTKVTAGRQDFKVHTGNVIDNTVDGISVAYGKQVKLTGYTGKAASFTGASEDRFYIADVATKLGVVDAYATYYKIDSALGNTEKDGAGYANDQDIYVLGAAAKVAKDLTLKAEWLHANIDEDNLDENGYYVGLAYKGASAAKAGSWGVYANYFDQPAATYVKHTVSGNYAMPGTDVKANDGFKGYEVGANYAIAKNVVAAVKYFDMESREGDAEEKTLWSEVTFSF